MNPHMKFADTQLYTFWDWTVENGYLDDIEDYVQAERTPGNPTYEEVPPDGT